MLKPKSFGLALGIVWAVMAGGTVLISLWTGYYKNFLDIFGPLHPWYSYSYLGVLIVTIENFLCGFISGALFAWLYNKFTK